MSPVTDLCNLASDSAGYRGMGVNATAWGRILREIRTERGYTQRDLAAAAGVGRSTIRRIEAGESPGTVEAIERCLYVLGYELEAMLRE